MWECTICQKYTQLGNWFLINVYYLFQTFQNLLAHDAPKRHKLSVHIVSTASTSPDDNSNQTPTVQVDGTSVMPPMGEVCTV